jgi:hypothetical protein
VQRELHMFGCNLMPMLLHESRQALQTRPVRKRSYPPAGATLALTLVTLTGQTLDVRVTCERKKLGSLALQCREAPVLGFARPP